MGQCKGRSSDQLHQGTRMATRQAIRLETSTATSILSLLILPLAQTLPQPTESQNWLARSTCVLDALAPGGVVDFQKFNECMDCWRSFARKTRQRMGRLVRFFVLSWVERCRTWSDVAAPQQASLCTGGGISFGSGVALGSGLGLAGLGTAFNAATANLFAGL